MDPDGIAWNTAPPPAAMAPAIARSSSSAAKVPGTQYPGMAR